MEPLDLLHRFLLEGDGVRGGIVRLDASWRAVLGRHPYPCAVQGYLGEALSACLLLSATIKFEGSLILQIQGQGPVRSLVAQATHRRAVRGLARWSGEVPAGTVAAAFGGGHLGLTIDMRGAERYQGIVALTGNRLSETLEAYFAQSEQLPTRLWLAADERGAGGLLLQELPSSSATEESWSRMVILADTLRPEELLSLPPLEVLYRLFHQERVRVLEAEPVSFRCSCSRERIEDTLRALGREELDSMLEERGSIEVDCEFCARHYVFDRVDVEALLAEERRLEVPPTRH